MYFASLSAGESHAQWVARRPLPGAPRIHEPLGGSLRAEAQCFRLLDLISYFHVRRGLVTREEIAWALPGWRERSAAAERLFYRTTITLQSTLGMHIVTESEPGAPAAYILRDRFASPLLAYASGRGAAPAGLASLPERNWTTVDCVHAACGILRTLAMTPREVLLAPDELSAQWPLTPTLLRQVLHRWQARVDLQLDHHCALRLLWCGPRFRLGTRWPLAPQARTSHETTHIRQEAA